MKKLYEIYFTLDADASIVISANSEEEAEEKLNQMSNNELLERIKNALDYAGVEITEIEELDDECDDDDEQSNLLYGKEHPWCLGNIWCDWNKTILLLHQSTIKANVS